MKNRYFSRIVVLFLTIALSFFIRENSVCLILQDTSSFNNDYSEYPTIITNLTTRIFIENENDIAVTDEITILNNRNTSLTQVIIRVDPPFRELEVNDLTQNPLSFDSIFEQNLILVDFGKELAFNETMTFRMTYFIDSQTIKTAGRPPRYLFNYNRTASYPILEYKLTIRIPRDSFIPDDIGIPYFPEVTNVQETGKVVYLNWEICDIDEGQVVYVHVFYEERTAMLPAAWIIVIALIGGICVGAILVFLLMRRKERGVLQEISNIYLTDDQKEILSIIVENDGKIIQGDLIRISGFTKSKVSRNLTPLETNGFITRERWGRESKIFLTDKGKKVLK